MKIDESTLARIDAFCREANIKRELIIPYNPQYCGVEGRKNRSIIETTKAMIHDLYLLMCLWA